LGLEDFDNLFNLEKTLNEVVEKEVDRSEDYFLGSLFLEEKSDEEPPRKRGRPKGVKETTPRKRKDSKIRKIKEHLMSFFEHVENLKVALQETQSKETR
jgi:hypothetical protein